jgi:hypothetical protein
MKSQKSFGFFLGQLGSCWRVLMLWKVRSPDSTTRCLPEYTNPPLKQHLRQPYS